MEVSAVPQIGKDGNMYKYIEMYTINTVRQKTGVKLSSFCFLYLVSV